MTLLWSSVLLPKQMNLGIIDRIETQVAIALESAVFAPDPVDAGNELFKATRLFADPSRLISYFSELRYSSLPGSRATFSQSSKAGP